MDGLNWLSAKDAARGIRDGLFSATDLARACIAQIEAREPEVQAWAYFDPEYVLRQARAADEWRAAGNALGSLHGVPVGIKDIIDTRDMPTEDGTPLHSGRTPWHDAKVIELLRCAGAVIMGKTVTTELATYSPGKTRNPHNSEHTPGGSSSGSAAAVAAGMVPLALGTQTNGSVIRPAAFCGVFGLKPTRGTVSRRGILKQSDRLDQPGCFARNAEDLALLCEVIMAYDEDDASMRLGPVPRLLATCEEAPPLPPKLAFVRTPWWSKVEPDVQEGLGELVGHLRDHVGEFELPASAEQVLEWQQTVMEADIAANYDEDFMRGGDSMSESLRRQIERGRATTAVAYLKAAARIPLIADAMDEIFDRFDAILTPAVTGAAPHGLSSTGDPLFCTLWTFCGMPAVSVPLLQAANGLPVGVQLVGRVGDDARLLRTARWLAKAIED